MRRLRGRWRRRLGWSGRESGCAVVARGRSNQESRLTAPRCEEKMPDELRGSMCGLKTGPHTALLEHLETVFEEKRYGRISQVP